MPTRTHIARTSNAQVPGLVPVSFGFDTAAKTYAEFVGNLQLDALSSQKYAAC
jgi:6-phosphofructokinase